MVSFTGACPISTREVEAKFWITLYSIWSNWEEWKIIARRGGANAGRSRDDELSPAMKMDRDADKLVKTYEKELTVLPLNMSTRSSNNIISF